MPKYIEREAFIEAKRKQYCADCDRRKGMKNGKMRFCYEIGEAPCRACYVDDLLTDVEDFPAADVVDGEAYRELLKAARKMHCWIFLNTADELDAYDECGLTDEMNALLGYGGQFTANMDGGVNDAAD